MSEQTKIINYYSVREWLDEKGFNGKYRERMEAIIQNYWGKFMQTPAARTHYSNYRGGLANHTFKVMYNAYILGCAFDKIDKEELVFLALAHDIGKIECYKMNGFKVTTVGEMDHIFSTIALLEEIGIHLNREQMKAIIAHHGGWSIDPKVVHNRLGILLHAADMLAVRDEEEGQ